MRKKKIALFYDEDTESGRKILEFLMPFDKRKSDIVGELILLWIAEHGTNVPVQWLDRKRGEPGQVRPCFPVKSAEAEKETNVANSAPQKTEAAESTEAVQDESLIKAGLASFM